MAEDILFYNIASLYTPGENDCVEKLNDQAIFVRGGRIHAMGDNDDLLRQFQGCDTINCHGKTMLPAFVDPHTHPVFWQTRQNEFILRTQGADYEEIAAAGGGIRNSVRSLRQASFDELLEITLHRMGRFIEYGTLTVEAKSGYGLNLEDEIKSLQVLRRIARDNLLPLTIVPTFLGAHEIPDEYRDSPDTYVDLLINEMIPQVAEEKLADYCDVFCESGVFTVAQTERILLSAQEYGLKAKLHADELHNTGGAELAASLKAVSADHLVCISDAGIEAMKRQGVVPVLLPATTFFLGKSRYAPARKMLDAGLPVALASDFNPGSSMTQNMHIVATLAALHLHMQPEEILCGQTLHAAQAIDLANERGSLAVGKAADMLLLDIPDLSYFAYHFAVNHIVAVVKEGEIVFPQV
jgi:imidazolonepropionase